MNLRTALIIQNNSNVRCEAGGPCKGPPEEEGKYVGWIVLNEGRWHPLLNTEPIYSSAEQAIKAMEDLVEAVKKADLSEEIQNLNKILSPALKT